MPYSITVSDNDALMAALSNAQGGETIYLQGGDYGSLILSSGSDTGFRFSETVRIVSADLDDPAVFSRMRLSDVSNIHIDSVCFDYNFMPGHPLWERPFRISGSEHVTISNSLFSGDTAHSTGSVNDGYPTGRGLSISGSNNISIQDNEIEGFHYGLWAVSSQDISISGNDFHSIRSDGLNFSNVQRVLIEDNHIHNFARAVRSSDHPDMIQFHQGTNSGSPSTDIIIRGNTFDAGAGYFVQSVFLGNEVVRNGRAGEEMFYRNILIEENVIINSQLHGITVGEADGVVIRNNSVLRVEVPTSGTGAGDIVTIPRITVAPSSTNVEITENVTSRITGFDAQPDWVIDGNFLVQYSRPEAEGWYGDMFVASSLQLDGIHHNYVVSPGSALELSGAGASAMRQPVSQAIFQFDAVHPGGPEVVFDAAIFGDQHSPGTTYHWDFGDGTTASGALVSHQFASAGQFDVMLTMVCPVAGISTAQSKIGVRARDYLQLNDEGRFVKNVFGEDEVLDSAFASNDGNLILGGEGVSVRLPRDLIAPFLTEKEVALNFSIKADDVGNGGEIFRIHNSLIASVNGAGEATVYVWSAEGGGVRLTSTGVRVNDGQAHAIKLHNSEGKLALWVNDELQAEAEFPGAIRISGHHDLTFGTDWHSASRFFHGELSEFGITLPKAAPNFPPATVHDPAVDIGMPDTDSLDLEESASHSETPPERPAPIVSHDTVTLGGGGIVSRIELAELSDLFTSKDISISFMLEAEAAGMRGEVFRLHGSLWVRVNRDGELVVQAKSVQDHDIHLISTGIRVNDGEAHAIEIQRADGKLSLWVNDELLAEEAFGGAFQQQAGRHDLTFGNQWHSASRFFNGELSEFRLDLSMPDPFSDQIAAQGELMDIPLI